MKRADAEREKKKRIKETTLCDVHFVYSLALLPFFPPFFFFLFCLHKVDEITHESKVIENTRSFLYNYIYISVILLLLYGSFCAAHLFLFCLCAFFFARHSSSALRAQNSTFRFAFRSLGCNCIYNSTAIPNGYKQQTHPNQSYWEDAKTRANEKLFDAKWNGNKSNDQQWSGLSGQTFGPHLGACDAIILTLSRSPSVLPVLLPDLLFFIFVLFRFLFY